jgi:hypothetical protein
MRQYQIEGRGSCMIKDEGLLLNETSRSLKCGVGTGRLSLCPSPFHLERVD